MEEVTLREFSINTYKYLKSFPLVVTKGGKKFIKITEIKDVATNSNVPSITDSNVATVERCSVDGCSSEADAFGRIWDELEQDFKEVPMCKKHALKSYKETI